MAEPGGRRGNFHKKDGGGTSVPWFLLAINHLIFKYLTSYLFRLSTLKGTAKTEF